MKREPDHLDLDSRRALALGYGVQYGRYKADHPVTPAEEAEPVSVKAPEKKPPVCRICGAEIPKRSKMRKYCSAECADEGRRRSLEAAREKARARKGAKK